MSDQKGDNLIVFGAGVGVGLLAIYVAIEALPFLAVGGVGYLIYRGLKANIQEDK